MFNRSRSNPPRVPWNKGKLMGQKLPFSMQEIWSIRMRLQSIGNHRDLTLFNLAIDSKLRACDLLSLRVSDVASGKEVQSRAIIRQKKTKHPVRFEITARTRKSLEDWIKAANLTKNSFLFPSRLRKSPHLSLRQYARIVESWVSSIGLDATAYGTHTMRWKCPSKLTSDQRERPSRDGRSANCLNCPGGRSQPIPRKYSFLHARTKITRQGTARVLFPRTQ